MKQDLKRWLRWFWLPSFIVLGWYGAVWYLWHPLSSVEMTIVAGGAVVVLMIPGSVALLILKME